MSLQDGSAQALEPHSTAVIAIALTLGLGVVPPVLDHLSRATLGASHSDEPTHRPDRLEALGVVDEGLEVEHR